MLVDADATEDRIRALWEQGDLRAATDLAIRAHGREIVSYLLALARNETEAGDAFSMFAEDMWRGLPRFRWESKLRTWMYVVARHALSQLRRDPYRNRGRCLDEAPEIYAAAEKVRTTTLAYLRSETKDRFARLREALDPGDRELLILRVDRGLPWRDVARVLAPSGDIDDEETLARDTARLRKRFERIKADLRARMREGEGE